MSNTTDDTAGSPGSTPESTPDRAGSRARGVIAGRKRVLLVSVAVAAVAGSVAAGTALAAGPALPAMSAQDLLSRTLNSHVETFSGKVEATVDLGIPSQLLSALPSAVGSKAGGTTDPQAALAEQQLLALLSGTHTADVASDGQTKQSFSITDAGRTVHAVHNGTNAWAYDSQRNEVMHYTGLAQGDTGATAQAAPSVTTPAKAADLLRQIAPYSNVSVDNTSMVAGRSVYILVVSPKGHGSTIGDVRVAVDAKNYMPLEVKVNPSDGGSPIADVRFAAISFDKPSASTFDFSAPAGAKVTTKAAQGHKAGAPGKAHPALPTKPHGVVPGQAGKNDVKVVGTGWTTVYEISPSATAKDGKAGGKNTLAELKTFGTPVNGGTLFSTKLINVFIADNGTIYAGAVTPSYLENLAK
ncbi:outer membrane lipoprotein-sorting protein [Streptacidiphilus sp. MAP12-20]|uniref:LolA family protein n=1 Tax=Streptacidiphilus sp. MAP12-20 TaxID=3156299 RepID=UPI0035148F21